MLQALKFGAQLASPCQAVKLDTDRNGDLLRLHLQGGEVIDSKVVVIATGARYRALPLERWPDFEGAGIYYAATELGRVPWIFGVGSCRSGRCWID